MTRCSYLLCDSGGSSEWSASIMSSGMLPVLPFSSGSSNERRIGSGPGAAAVDAAAVDPRFGTAAGPAAAAAREDAPFGIEARVGATAAAPPAAKFGTASCGGSEFAAGPAGCVCDDRRTAALEPEVICAAADEAAFSRAAALPAGRSGLGLTGAPRGESAGSIRRATCHVSGSHAGCMGARTGTHMPTRSCASARACQASTPDARDAVCAPVGSPPCRARPSRSLAAVHCPRPARPSARPSPRRRHDRPQPLPRRAHQRSRPAPSASQPMQHGPSRPTRGQLDLTAVGPAGGARGRTGARTHARTHAPNRFAGARCAALPTGVAAAPCLP